MSKNKGKDKKGDVPSGMEAQYEIQKRDLIDLQYTVKKVEERLKQKIIESEQLSKELEQTRQLNEQKIQLLNDRAEDDEKRMNNQINKITELEINATRYESQINSLKEQLSLEKQARSKEVNDLKIKMETERMKFEVQLKDLQIYAESRDKNEQQILELRQKIEHQKGERIRELADKEREKIQTTDKVRDEALKKIKQMQTNLLSLKKEELSTTTRLTILQNHQLTSELEYQSKQTQKLIFKEEDLVNKIKKMSQQIIVHKQVEQQLAKRAHFSKGIIKKLNERVTQLEEENKNLKSVQEKKAPKSNLKKSTAHLNRESLSQYSSQIKSKIFIDYEEGNITVNATKGNDQSSKNMKELTVQIQKQLSMTEKKFMELESKFEAQSKEKDSLLRQISKIQHISNELVKMLITYSEEILGKNELQLDKQDPPDGKQKDDNLTMVVQMDELREVDVEKWSHEQISLVTKILINLVRPYLTKKNIMIPPIKRLLVIEDSLNAPQSDNKLPKLTGEKENIVSGLKNIPINIRSKIVGSNLREWGATVRSNNHHHKLSLIKQKFKISQSQR